LAGWFIRAALLVGLLAAVPSAPAHADGVADEAEINFRLGAERYQAGDYRAALAFFLASQRLAPNRNVRFNIVRTFQRLSMHPEAFRWCEEALRDESDPAQRAELAQLLEQIEQDVAVIEVVSDPPGATIYVDRVELGSLARTPARLALGEGQHRVILELEGYRRSELPPVVAEKHKRVRVSAQLTRVVGLVRVSSDQPSEVRVDSESAELECLTPCNLELSPGAHLLFFRRSGYRLAAQQVRVQPGRTVELRAEAVPLTGSVLVTADARDALVEVDGVPRGFTPAVVDRVPVGKRQVRVSLAGYEPLTREVEIREGQPAQLPNLTLTPKRQVTAASKQDESVDDAPASVSVISSYELDAFRYPTIAEALRGQRGVALSTDSVYHGLSLRGLGQPGDYGNRVLVLSDGATLNDNILWQSYVGYDGRVDLGDLSRIELVRGPGSVLYGTGAVTGLVNLVSAAQPDRPVGEVRISANDARTARARASYAHPFGKRAGFSLSLAGAHSDGRDVRLPTDPTPTPVAGVERFDAVTAQVRGRWNDLAVQGFFSLRKQDVPAGAYGAVIGHGDQNWVRDARGLLELRYEPALLGERLRLYTRAFANLYRFDSEQLFEEAAQIDTNERYRGYWGGAEARLVGALSERLRLTVGGEVQVNVRASLYGASRSQSTSSGTLDSDTPYLDTNTPYQIYAGYALLDVRVSRHVALSAGARVDAWSTFGATVNPRLNLVIRPSPGHVLKLVGGRAFRAPSIYELHYRDANTQEPSTFNGNKLGPELAWSGEVEYTYRFLQHWAVLAAVHGQYAEALMEQASTMPGVPGSPVYYRNSDNQALTLGGDVELRRELYGGLLFATSYGYLYARWIGQAPGGSSRLPNAPAHYAAFRLVVPVWAETKLALRTALEAPRRIGSDSRELTGTAAITDLVFSGFLGKSGFDFAVGVYNLFDFRLGLPTESTFVTHTMPQPGRTLLVSLGLRVQ
jgi:outer membrane receptor for ferrienterochelin and colicin